MAISTDSALPENRVKISEDFRSMNVPTHEQVLGCVGDAWVRRVWFDMPRYCDGTDLSGYTLSVNYRNTEEDEDRYTVSDAVVNADTITFSWLVGAVACAAPGLTSVSIKAQKLNGDTVEHEFNSTIYYFKVLPANTTGAEPIQEYSDAFTALVLQWQAEVDAARKNTTLVNKSSGNIAKLIDYSLVNTNWSFTGDPQTYGNFNMSEMVSLEGWKYISFKLPYYYYDVVSVTPIAFFAAATDESPIMCVSTSNMYITNNPEESTGYGYGFIAIPENANFARFLSYGQYSDTLIKLYKNKPYPCVVGSNVDTVDVFSLNALKAVFTTSEKVSAFIENGTYTEVVLFIANYPFVKLEGESRDGVVLQSLTGKYGDSPLVIAGDFVVENMTLKMLVNGTFTPTYGDDVWNTYPGYAIHIDSPSIDSSKEAYGVVKNCTLYSEAAPAVGMGLHKNQYVGFSECTIERKTTNQAFIRPDWKGAFYCHNALEAESDTNANENQNLIVKDCSIRCNYGYAAHLRLALGANVNNSKTNVVVEFLRTGFFSDQLRQDCCCIEKNYLRLSPNSFGNTVKALNAVDETDTASYFNNIFDLNFDYSIGTLQGSTVSPSGGWFITPFIKPELGSSIAYQSDSVGGLVSTIAFYDENFNLLPNLSVTSDAGTVVVPTGESVKYIRACFPAYINNAYYLRGNFYLTHQ